MGLAERRSSRMCCQSSSRQSHGPDAMGRPPRCTVDALSDSRDSLLDASLRPEPSAFLMLSFINQPSQSVVCF